MRVGYLIVRKPAECYDPRGLAVGVPTAPPRGTILYEGVDRMPWYDVETAFWSKTASNDVRETYQYLRSCNEAGTLPLLSSSLATCERLIREVENATLNEVLCVSFPQRADYRSRTTIECDDPPPVIGYDVVIEGEFSLLASGIYSRVSPSLVNAHGLLSGLDNVNALIEEYEHLVALGLAEPCPALRDRCVTIAVRAPAEGAG